jgi:hypothetical protein
MRDQIACHNIVLNSEILYLLGKAIGAITKEFKVKNYRLKYNIMSAWSKLKLWTVLVYAINSVQARKSSKIKYKPVNGARLNIIRN